MTTDRLPHICFVAPEAYPVLAGGGSTQFIGGAELQQVIVAQGLAQRGFRVSMICLDYGQADTVQVGGVTVYKAYRPDQGIPKLRFLWPRLTSLLSCMKRVNADIYYQRTAGLMTGIVAAYCRRSGKKSVFAAAGNPDLEPRTPRIGSSWARKLFEYGLRRVDRILVQNEGQARLCRSNPGREPILVPNCYPPPTGGTAVEADRVLWVSTIRAVKRPHLYLDLAEALPRLRFTMAGGPDRVEQRLFDAIRRRAEGISNLEFLGFVPHGEIDEHFARASLFVNTSESEGFPNTFLQAWSRAIPTVSFIDSGARLAESPVGQIVHSTSEMTAVVARLMQSEETRLRIGKSCQDYFNANHRPDQVLAMYEKIFIELCAESETAGSNSP